MTKLINLTNQKYGRLLVISRADSDARGRSRWLCRCDCGNKTTVGVSNLGNGKTKSCGCLRQELTSIRRTTHGHTVNGHRSRTYTSWEGMIKRCENPNNNRYHYYGGRGITVCKRWKLFDNFLADMGERPEGSSIDRYPDNDGNYEPDNCRWATSKEQCANRRKASI